MADPFTRDRFCWLDALAADPEMTPGDFLVGYAIATTVKRNSGTKALVSTSNDPGDVVCEAWIGAKEIAKRIGMSHGTVFARTENLEQHGYIQIDPGQRGSGHSSHYRLVEKGQPADISGKKKGQPADISKKPEKPKGQPADYLSPENVSPLTLKGQPADMNPLLPLKDTIEEEDSPRPRLDLKEDGRREVIVADTIEADFGEFYRCYPKHVARAAALKSYRAVITKKLATPATLLDGAVRYAAERANQDPKYTKHASTWLAGGCWDDEIAPTGGGYRPPNGRPDPIAVSEQIARQLMAKNGGGYVQ
jgi:hypothetical protein